jgi:hypothetical protein
MTNNFMEWPDPGTALVTGASSGIGTEYARQLAAQGFSLVLVARRQERLEGLAEEIKAANGVEVESIVADLSVQGDIERVCAKVKQLDTLDLLVSNAGFGTVGKFQEVPLARSLDMMTVHNVAAVELSHAALPSMIERNRGVIILVASVMAASFMPGNTVYSATKAFLKVFAENLALELKRSQVRIQALCPGFTDTEYFRVGDFEGWDRSVVPEHLWMGADEVVSQSLANIKEDGNVVFVPGESNNEMYRKAAGSFVKRRTSI